jgi:predicted metalloprotease
VMSNLRCRRRRLLATIDCNDSRSYVVPDAFTYRSSLRTRWFTTGLKLGAVPSCDTFSAAQL